MPKVHRFSPARQAGRLSISEVCISKRDDPKLKAYVSIILDACFVIRGCKVIQGNRGLFLAMPCRKRPDGSFQDLAHPVDNLTRRELERAVLEAYFDDDLMEAAMPVPLPDGPRTREAAAMRPYPNWASAGQ